MGEDDGSEPSRQEDDDAQRKATADRILAALRKSNAELYRRKKLLGEPIVVWRDGKVVILPPEEIPDLSEDL